MLSCSRVLLASHSKRLLVQLRSAAGTNACYLTRKSPHKKDFRIALRKYDPEVNKHVGCFFVGLEVRPPSEKAEKQLTARRQRYTTMFYEARLPSEKAKKQLTARLQRYIRWTGKHVKLLLARVEKAWEYGRYQKYFDNQAPLLTDRKGR